MKKILNVLASYKFAAIIIFAITILALIGSFIPQQQGNFNIYGSFVFIILLGLFALNLVLCTLKLIPFTKKGYDNFNVTLSKKSVLENTTKENFLKKLSDSGWKIQEQGKIFRAVKNRIGRLGVIILHTGIIVVLLGALVGYLFGFKGFMNILEGTSDDVAVLPDGTLVPLGFELACDDFIAEYYEGTRRPKSYTSILRVIDNGKEVEKAVIDVNHPLKYKGIVFYQTNFGIYPNSNAKIKANIKSDNKNNDIVISFGESFRLTDTLTGKVTDFAPTLAVDNEGKIFSASDEMDNPALLLEVYKGTEPEFRGWVLQSNPETGVFKDLGFEFKFGELWGVEYTGLSVKKDPGTFVVYLGFILILLGLMVTYMQNYTAIFFTIENDDDKLAVCYAIKKQRMYALVRPEMGFRKILHDLQEVM